MRKLAAHHPDVRRLRLMVMQGAHPLRERASAFIRQVYRQHHGADVRQIPPALLALVDDAGGIHCVAGLRMAQDGFFCRHYLDLPLEQQLSHVASVPVQQEAIVEVGSLASRSPACSMHFIGMIVQFYRQQGFEWAVFTVTRRLSLLLRRTGLPLVELARARPERVPDPESWGTYYDADPRVCAVSRVQAEQFLAAHPPLPHMEVPS